MTKETIGYVKLEWECPSCRSKNPGPQKTCRECGAPQPEDVQFEQAAEEKLITEEAEIARAKAGPDVHCAYCGARNPATTETCSQCGADLKEAEARVSFGVLGAHRDEPAADVPCPSCGALNTATAQECSQCGASLARPKPRPRAAQARKGGCGWVAYAIIGGIVLLVAVFFILSSRTTDVVGRVTSVGWTRSIAIQALRPVTRETWREDVPSGGVVGSCKPQVHHTQDEAAPNSDKVCGTPYTVDTGSGFGEVVQDCEYQVYEDWCAYSVQEWQVIDTITQEGQDYGPQWPITQLAAGQREGGRDESYTCVFDADGKRYTYRTRDTQEFARCEIGSRWTLKVNALSGVVDMEPAD